MQCLNNRLVKVDYLKMNVDVALGLNLKLSKL